MKRNILIIIGLLLLAFGAGYVVSQNNDAGNKSTDTPDVVQDSAAPEVSDDSLKEAVRYTLPDGWIEQSCAASNAQFIVPNGSTANCDDNPVSPVKLSMDSGNHTDCNQLQNQSNVKTHTCISEFINGRKTLKTKTVFLDSSSYGKETEVDAYYFDSGSGVILAEYIHEPDDNRHQMDFEKLAKSLQAI